MHISLNEPRLVRKGLALAISFFALAAAAGFATPANAISYVTPVDASEEYPNNASLVGEASCPAEDGTFTVTFTLNINIQGGTFVGIDDHTQYPNEWAYGVGIDLISNSTDVPTNGYNNNLFTDVSGNGIYATTTSFNATGTVEARGTVVWYDSETATYYGLPVSVIISEPAPCSSSSSSGGSNKVTIVRRGGGSPGPGMGGQVLGAQTGECSAYLIANIRLGGQNDPAEVLKLQQFLNDFEANNLALTGVYDQATYQAVLAFQLKYAAQILTPWGISQPTGFVYHTTKKTINELHCRFTKAFPLTSQQEAEIARVRALGQAIGGGAGATSAPFSPSQIQLPSQQGAAPAISTTSVVGAADPDTDADTGEVAGEETSTEEGGSAWSRFWNWLLGR